MSYACAAPETALPTLPIAPPTNGLQQVEKVSTHNQHIEKGLYVKHPKRALTDEEPLSLTRVKEPRLMPKSVSGNNEHHRKSLRNQVKTEKCAACLKWKNYCDQEKPCGSCVKRGYTCYPQGEIRLPRAQDKAKKCAPCLTWKLIYNQEKPCGSCVKRGYTCYPQGETRPSPGQDKAEKCAPCRRRERFCDKEKPCGSCKKTKSICYPQGKIRPSQGQDKAEECALCRKWERYCDKEKPCGTCVKNKLKCCPQGPPRTALPTARPVPSEQFLGTWSNSSDDEDPSTVQHSNESSSQMMKVYFKALVDKEKLGVPWDEEYERAWFARYYKKKKDEADARRQCQLK
jgi:hypothetical protein